MAADDAYGNPGKKTTKRKLYQYGGKYHTKSQAQVKKEKAAKAAKNPPLGPGLLPGTQGLPATAQYDPYFGTKGYYSPFAPVTPGQLNQRASTEANAMTTAELGALPTEAAVTAPFTKKSADVSGLNAALLSALSNIGSSNAGYMGAIGNSAGIQATQSNDSANRLAMASGGNPQALDGGGLSALTQIGANSQAVQGATQNAAAIRGNMASNEVLSELTKALAERAAAATAIKAKTGAYRQESLDKGRAEQNAAQTQLMNWGMGFQQLNSLDKYRQGQQAISRQGQIEDTKVANDKIALDKAYKAEMLRLSQDRNDIARSKILANPSGASNIGKWDSTIASIIDDARQTYGATSKKGSKTKNTGFRVNYTQLQKGSIVNNTTDKEIKRTSPEFKTEKAAREWINKTNKNGNAGFGNFRVESLGTTDVSTSAQGPYWPTFNSLYNRLSNVNKQYGFGIPDAQVRAQVQAAMGMAGYRAK